MPINRRNLVAGGLAALFAPAIIKTFPILLPKQPILDLRPVVPNDVYIKPVFFKYKVRISYVLRGKDYLADLSIVPAQPDDPEYMVWTADGRNLKDSDSLPRLLKLSLPESKTTKALLHVST